MSMTGVSGRYDGFPDASHYDIVSGNRSSQTESLSNTGEERDTLPSAAHASPDMQCKRSEVHCISI